MTFSTLARPVNVVVPVYGATRAARACLESVVATLPTGARLTVVDDASPDPETGELLAAFAGCPGVRILRNDRNQGFTVTANRGLREQPEADAILLNSDTVVANDWVARLQRCAASRARVATVTPFSNNATLCSYPRFFYTNPLPEGWSVGAIDRLFAQTNAGESIELPTGVGFCMYITRDAISELGLLDEASFPRGYGEENDFCRRAVKAGLSNLLCADVFVYHEGGASFTEPGPLQQAGEAALARLHPEYEAAVFDFFARDPARPLRHAVDLARARQSAEEARRVLEERYVESTSCCADAWRLRWERRVMHASPVVPSGVRPLWSRVFDRLRRRENVR